MPYLIEVNTGQGRAGVGPERIVELAGALDALTGLERRLRLGSVTLDRCALTVLGRLISTQRPGVAISTRAPRR